MSSIAEQRTAISDAILWEILGVMGLRGQRWSHPIVRSVFRTPVGHITEILREFDEQVGALGWHTAIKNFSTHFIKDVRVLGAEEIPESGALVVASNHPGSYDVIALSASILRDDVKIISSQLGFLHALPNVQEHFITISSEVTRRMAAVRESLRHLHQGGALLIFPRGQVEPDPAVWPGSLPDFSRWYGSLEVFLRKAPETRMVAAIASGVLSKRWFDHPIPRMQKRIEQRQKVAEIFQVAQLLRNSGAPTIEPLISFSPPIDFSGAEFQNPEEGAFMEAIKKVASGLLPAHYAVTNTQG